MLCVYGAIFTAFYIFSFSFFSFFTEMITVFPFHVEQRYKDTKTMIPFDKQERRRDANVWRNDVSKGGVKREENVR